MLLCGGGSRSCLPACLPARLPPALPLCLPPCLPAMQVDRDPLRVSIMHLKEQVGRRVLPRCAWPAPFCQDLPDPAHAGAPTTTLPPTHIHTCASAAHMTTPPCSRTTHLTTCCGRPPWKSSPPSRSCCTCTRCTTSRCATSYRWGGGRAGGCLFGGWVGAAWCLPMHGCCRCCTPHPLSHCATAPTRRPHAPLTPHLCFTLPHLSFLSSRPRAFLSVWRRLPRPVPPGRPGHQPDQRRQRRAAGGAGAAERAGEVGRLGRGGGGGGGGGGGDDGPSQAALARWIQVQGQPRLSRLSHPATTTTTTTPHTHARANTHHTHMPPSPQGPPGAGAAEEGGGAVPPAGGAGCVVVVVVGCPLFWLACVPLCTSSSLRWEANPRRSTCRCGRKGGYAAAPPPRSSCHCCCYRGRDAMPWLCCCWVNALYRPVPPCRPT